MRVMTKVDGGKHFYSHQDKKLPMNSDSVFGNFPAGARVKANQLVADPKVLNCQEASIAVTGKATLKKGEGSGGRTNSKMIGKYQCKVSAPVSGATAKRLV